LSTAARELLQHRLARRPPGPPRVLVGHIVDALDRVERDHADRGPLL
jgi:hypothetical protein